jgi:RNA polymerase sigma-70 factor (ECF subfamily)
MDEAEHSSAGSNDPRRGASQSSLEDDILVRRARGGSEEAQTALVNKYRRAIHFHILKMIKDENSGEDLVQETFIKAFNNLQRYDDNYAFSTWLYRIATNHTIDYLRKKKLKTVSINNQVRTREGRREMQLRDGSTQTDRRIIRSQRREKVRSAIDNLPDKYRRVIQLRHMQELTYQEIVEVLDIPLGTVKAHIFRAREMLYKTLKDDFDNEL